MRLRPHRVLSGLVLLAVVFLYSSRAASRPLPIPGSEFASRAIADDKTDAPPADNSDLATEAAVKSEVDLAVDTPFHSPEADERLARADRHFNLGRQYYFQEKLTEARREFDAAVDALLNAPDSLPDHRRIERRLDEMCDVIYRLDVEKLGSGEAA